MDPSAAGGGGSERQRRRRAVHRPWRTGLLLQLLLFLLGAGQDGRHASWLEEVAGSLNEGGQGLAGRLQSAQS